MKKIIVLALSTVFLVGVFAVAAPASAVTLQELQNQIQSLLGQVKQLQTQNQTANVIDSAAETTADSSMAWCFGFKQNLRRTDTGRQVGHLQTALEKEGFTVRKLEKHNNEFGDSTKSAVIGFQNKYKDEVLTPLGKTSGTGFVGNTTRAKLNQLYGCGAVVSATTITPTTTTTVTPTETMTTTATPGITSEPTSPTTVIEPIPRPPITSPSITVVSPNGGERWEKGKSYSIKWKSFGISSTATVFIRFAANNLNYIKSLETINDGEELFTISSDMIIADDYMVDIYYIYGSGPDCPSDSYLPSCAYIDFSDAAFSLVEGTTSGMLSVSLDAATPVARTVAAGSKNVSITVLKVHASSEDVLLQRIALQFGGSNRMAVERYSVWDHATKVGEGIFTNNNYSTTTLTNKVIVPKDGDKLLTLKVDIASNPLAQTGDVIIINYDGDDPTGTRGIGQSSGLFIYPFSKYDTNASKITVGDSLITLTSPNGGEKWQIGSMHTITWAPYEPDSGINPADSVTAYLEKRSSDGQFITLGRIVEGGRASLHWDGISLLDNSGNYLEATPGDYYVRVVNMTVNMPNASDRSDNAFKLMPRDSVTADLKLNGSNGPIKVPDGGANYTASWTSNANNCNIYNNTLPWPDGFIGNLAPSGKRIIKLMPNTETYDKNISLWCNSTSDIEGYAWDEVLVFPSAATKFSAKITSPNGGELFNYNSWNLITYQTSGVETVSLALYKNNKFFAWIVKDKPNYKGTNWNSHYLIPSEIISQDKIGKNIFKIYMIGKKSGARGTVTDISDKPFTIGN